MSVLITVAVVLSLIISPVTGIINFFKLSKMNDLFQSYEAFLQSIGASLTTISSALAQLAAGVNPSGLTADEAAKLSADLKAVSDQASATATAAQTAAAAAGQGQTAPAPVTAASPTA